MEETQGIMAKEKIVIKQEDIRKVRIGKGYTERPMVQADKKKKRDKNLCRKKIVVPIDR